MLISSKNITGLILAGGRGQRVEEQDKGLLLYQGTKLIEKQITWFELQVSKIIISANRNITEYQKYNYPVYQDPCQSQAIEYSGPLTGLVTCLKQCQTEWLYVQPVDMPLLPENLIEQLCQSIINKADIYYLKSAERSHYLSMLISKKTLPLLESFLSEGNKKVKLFLDSVGAIAIDLAIEERKFGNLNYLTDYQ